MADMVPRVCQLCGRMADPYDGGYYHCDPVQGPIYADEVKFRLPLPGLVICQRCMLKMVDLYIADMKK